jgi:hypothetical protein
MNKFFENPLLPTARKCNARIAFLAEEREGLNAIK